MKKWTIYKIENQIGQIYIGCTSRFKERVSCYKNLSGRLYRQKALFASFSSYGFNKHNISILEEFESDKSCAEGKEMFWIRSFMSNRNKWPEHNGLNSTDGGSGWLNGKHSDDHKKYMSIKLTGRVFSIETQLKKKPLYERLSIMRMRAVNQYDLNGAFIKRHDSIKSASEETGCKRPHISACLSGRGRQTRGFKFKYA